MRRLRSYATPVLAVLLTLAFIILASDRVAWAGGELYMAGNRISPPYTFSVVDSGLAVNGYQLPDPPPRPVPRRVPTPADSAKHALNLSAGRLGEQLWRLGKSQDEVLSGVRAYYAASVLVSSAVIDRDVIVVTYIDGSRMGFPLQSPVARKSPRPPVPTMRELMAPQIESLQYALSLGCAVFLISRSETLYLPSSDMAELHEAIERTQRGLPLTERQTRLLAPVREQILHPLKLRRTRQRQTKQDTKAMDLRAAAGSGGSAPSISAPESWSTIGGLGFSIAATITDPDPEDSVTVTVTGAPQGTSLRVVRVQGGTTVAALAGVISRSAGPNDYNITWEAVDSEGLTSRSQSVISVSPPATGKIGVKVRQLIRQRYEFGIPSKDVRDLGAASLPYILEVLRDTTDQKYWPTAVVAAGMLGLPQVFDSLHAFIWSRFGGGVARDAFTALCRAQAVLGSVAPARPEVIDYLIAGADPAYWVNLPWHYWTYSPDGYLGVVMAGRSIYGLSIIADGRAVEALNALSQAPLDADRRVYVKEAIERQQLVLQKGWMAVREEVQRKSAGGQ